MTCRCPSCGHEFEPAPEPARGCPVSKIVALYHQILHELPACQKITSKRRGQIQQRWRSDLTDREDWELFFERVRASDFLMGRAVAAPGRKVFRADLEWITNETNFAKIIEGKYDNGQVSRPEQTINPRRYRGAVATEQPSLLSQVQLGLRERQ